MSDGGEVQICLQRIIMFVQYCSDQTCSSEKVMQYYLSTSKVDSPGTNCNTDCSLTTVINIKFLFIP